eukprot:5675589-Amphidinium_carterae.1
MSGKWGVKSMFFKHAFTKFSSFAKLNTCSCQLYGKFWLGFFEQESARFVGGLGWETCEA